MAELENKRNVEEDVTNTDVVDALKDLQENSVSKEKYEALEANYNAERKKWVDAFVNGRLEDESGEEKLESRLEYYKRFKENNFPTDLDTMTNLINLRKATIKEYGLDPCVTGNYGLTPEGGKLEPAYGEAETIQEQFDILEEIVKEANGNPLEYQRLLQAHLPRK